MDVSCFFVFRMIILINKNIELDGNREERTKRWGRCWCVAIKGLWRVPKSKNPLKLLAFKEFPNLPDTCFSCWHRFSWIPQHNPVIVAAASIRRGANFFVLTVYYLSEWSATHRTSRRGWSHVSLRSHHPQNFPWEPNHGRHTQSCLPAAVHLKERDWVLALVPHKSTKARAPSQDRETEDKEKIGALESAKMLRWLLRGLSHCHCCFMIRETTEIVFKAQTVPTKNTIVLGFLLWWCANLS